MARLKQAKLGSVSSGTLRPEDLIPAFVAELRRYRPRGRLPLQLHKSVIQALAVRPGSNLICDPNDTVNDLMDALEQYAPNYGYFGTNDGDGADFGFWLCTTWQQDARENGALFVSDLSEVPERHYGEVVVVNDHGNATLYYRTKRKLVEVWSIA